MTVEGVLAGIVSHGGAEECVKVTSITPDFTIMVVGLIGCQPYCVFRRILLAPIGALVFILVYYIPSGRQAGHFLRFFQISERQHSIMGSSPLCIGGDSEGANT